MGSAECSPEKEERTVVVKTLILPEEVGKVMNAIHSEQSGK